MITKLLRRIAPARMLRAERGYWDQNVNDLGRAAEVSGSFLAQNKHLLRKHGFVAVGRLDYSWDRRIIARDIDGQLAIKFLLWLRQRKYALNSFLWRWGILDTPEGQIIRYRSDLRVNPIRVLRARTHRYGIHVLPQALHRVLSLYQARSRAH